MNLTINILQRTFYIKCGEKTGTCFTIDVDGLQYIITAWHLAESIQDSKAVVEIMHKKSWKPLEVRLVGHGGSQQEDISVLAPSVRMVSGPPVQISTNMHFGQETRFLGFPYGYTTEVGDVTNNYPAPWVKTGIMSSRDSRHIYLDGHNNPGFSGGPVVCEPINKKTGTIEKGKLAIIGVVSSYISFLKSVYYQEKESMLKYEQNTGIVVVRDIKLALDIIRQNPIGYPLAT